MTKTIEHKGTIKSINGNLIKVRILQTTGCASCSAKDFCSSAESKEKIIDVRDPNSQFYSVGDDVTLHGSMTLGLRAVLLAFFFPFLVLVTSLFISMHLTHQDELLSTGIAFGLTALYYLILSLFKQQTRKHFAFTLSK